MENKKKKKVLLNRALFVRRPLDSAELPVLTALFHRFNEPGDYQALLRRGDSLLRRFAVRVVEEGGLPQINLDLAGAPPESKDCAPEQYTLQSGGVMGFYASKGVGQYSVSISPLGRAGRRTGETTVAKSATLDSRKAIPAGDLFSATLVREGHYRVTNLEGHGEAWIEVRQPKGEPYSMAHAERVDYGRDGFKPEKVTLLAGQSVVFQCSLPARLRIEPTG